MKLSNDSHWVSDSDLYLCKTKTSSDHTYMPIYLFMFLSSMLGRRKLELFGSYRTIRPGWLTIGLDMQYCAHDPQTQFDAETYASWFENLHGDKSNPTAGWDTTSFDGGAAAEYLGIKSTSQVCELELPLFEYIQYRQALWLAFSSPGSAVQLTPPSPGRKNLWRIATLIRKLLPTMEVALKEALRVSAICVSARARPPYFTGLEFLRPKSPTGRAAGGQAR